MVLYGDRIDLREISPSDTEDILRWRNSDEVRRFFINRELFTEESHRAWLQQYVATGKAVQFIMVDQGSQQSFGSVYLRDIDHTHKKAEFGIFIGEQKYRGEGYGAAATRLILDYGFLQLKLNKIFLRVLADNTRAIKSYEKVGFQIEGCFRQEYLLDGRYEDLIFMAYLKEDYVLRGKDLTSMDNI